MKPQEKRAFRDFLTDEVHSKPSANDPVGVIRRIAAHSDDADAQIMAIRMLAKELMSTEPPRIDLTAKWAVVVVAPK